MNQAITTNLRGLVQIDTNERHSLTIAFLIAIRFQWNTEQLPIKLSTPAYQHEYQRQ